ncbi:PKD domain-containing protein [Kitasatospora camelliae]|uniref:PKD domain-containing protein n=1 Tax=Kitasatospora camelliae TaxID=3156397 RepID=A0AAU8K694_9ACTN
MRLRQSAALTVAAATSVLVFPAVSVAADTPGGTLYVNRTSAACADAGGGSEARPFCTISAAAAVVLPGQTVEVAAGSGTYQETVRITRSGTPEQPITFLGVTFDRPQAGRPVVLQPSSGAGSFVLAEVHDVVVRGFDVQGTRTAGSAPAVAVSNSSRVTLDQNRYYGTIDPSVRTSGANGQLTVSRSRFSSAGGLVVGAGAHDVLITGNDFDRSRTAAVTVTDAPNTAVTSNTIAFSCLESVRIDGASPGAVVENNVITAEHTDDTTVTPAPACATDPRFKGEAEIVVSAGSVSGSKVDYNLVHPWSDGSGYAWGGTAYRTAAAFKEATGQAGHDVDVRLSFNPIVNIDHNRLPETATAAIDSADPSAPGLDRDLLGVKPGDDPKVPNTAPNGGIRDRGAYEVHGQRSLGLTVTADVPSLQGPTPFTVKATAAPVNAWGVDQVNYRFSFGDGTRIDSPEPTVTHTYTKAGTYFVSCLATDAQGAKMFSEYKQVLVRDPADLTADLTYRLGDSLDLTVTPSASSPWVITGRQVDFGDGTKLSQPAADGTFKHQYGAPGSYQVALTTTDEGGRSVVTRRTVDVPGAAYTAALAPGDRVQLFGGRTGSPSSLINAGANYTRGVWSPFLPVSPQGAPIEGKGVAATASVTTADQYLRAFVLVDGKVYSADRNLGPASGGVAQGQWLPWSEVTGAARAGDLPGITQLTAAAIGNRVHLVAVADGRVYEASGERSTGTWSAWGDVTAVLGFPAGVTSVAAASTGNVLHVAMLGADGRVRVGDGDYDRGRWSGGDLTAAIGVPTNAPLAPITQLAAATTPGSKFHVVAQVPGEIYEAVADYAAGRWSGWGNISRETGTGLYNTRQIAVAATGNTLRVFGVDRFSNAVYTADGDYTAGRWSRSAQVNVPGAAGPLSPFDPDADVVSLSAAGL